jgi:hypothetical protein
MSEIIAERWGFPLATKPVEGKLYYAVQDWIVGVARVKNPRRFWSDMKRLAKDAGIDLYHSIEQLPYQRHNRENPVDSIFLSLVLQAPGVTPRGLLRAYHPADIISRPQPQKSCASGTP